jgi:hypothetical protein
MRLGADIPRCPEFRLFAFVLREMMADGRRTASRLPFGSLVLDL